MPFTDKTGEEEFNGGEGIDGDFDEGVTGDNNEEQEIVEVDGFFLMAGEGVVVKVGDWVYEETPLILLGSLSPILECLQSSSTSPQVCSSCPSYS